MTSYLRICAQKRDKITAQIVSVQIEREKENSTKLKVLTKIY